MISSGLAGATVKSRVEDQEDGLMISSGLAGATVKSRVEDQQEDV